MASVGPTLKTLGFSAQRPLYRAEQADAVGVPPWKDIEYPKITAEAQTAGGHTEQADGCSVRRVVRECLHAVEFNRAGSDSENSSMRSPSSMER